MRRSSKSTCRSAAARFTLRGASGAEAGNPSLYSLIEVTTSYLGATHFQFRSEAILNPGLPLVVAGDPVAWQNLESTAISDHWGFDPFHTRVFTPVIAPGETFTVGYLMRLKTDMGGFGGVGASGFLSDPFDVSGNLRTEAPETFGGFAVTAADNPVPEPATLVTGVFSLLLMAACRVRHNLLRSRRRPPLQ